MSFEHIEAFPEEKGGPTFEDKIKDLAKKARDNGKPEPLLEKIDLGFVTEAEFEEVGQIVNEVGASERSFLGISEEDAQRIFPKIKRYVLNQELRGNLKTKNELRREILSDLETAAG